MQSSLKSLVRRPNGCSAAAPDGPTAAGSGGLDQNDPEAPPNDPEIGAKAAAKASDGASLLSDRLAVLPTLSLVEWRRLFRAEPPRLSRDMMMRAVALPVAGNRPWRPVQSDAAPIDDPDRGIRNGREDRAAARAKDQTRLAPRSRMAWANPHGLRHRRRVRD